MEQPLALLATKRNNNVDFLLHWKKKEAGTMLFSRRFLVLSTTFLLVFLGERIDLRSRTALAAAAAATATPALASCDNHRLIIAYMIYTKHRRRSYDYVKNFTSTIFAGDNETIEFRFLPPVQSEACGDEPFRRVKQVFDKNRGGLLTHINVWDHFYRRRRHHCEVRASQSLVS